MIKVFKSNNQDGKFYALMGRYFASLDIAKELEAQVYNKDNTDWYLFTYKTDVWGFVSVFDSGKYYFIDNLYVVPTARNTGIATELLEEVAAIYTDKPLRAVVCNPYAWAVFEKLGFVEVGKNGKYKKVLKC